MSEWLIAGGIAAAIAIPYALFLRHLNIVPRRPTYKAERNYGDLTIGMERWGAKDSFGSPDTLTIYAHGFFKGRRIRDINLGLIETTTEKEMPMETVVGWINQRLTLDVNETLPEDDPKLMGLLNDLYDEMRIPRLKQFQDKN